MRYDQVIVARIGLRSAGVSAWVTGLFRVPPSRNAWNTRRHTCMNGAKASVHPGVSSLLLRTYTTTGTLLVPAFQCLGVVSRGGV